MRLYLSHPIRGIKGNKAMLEDIKKNNKKAKEIGEELRCWLIFNDLIDHNEDLYVPADHDEIIIILYSAGKLSEDDILWADCEIIRKCDILLVYDPDKQLSNGMRKEWVFAEAHGIPIFQFDSAKWQTLKRLVERIGNELESNDKGRDTSTLELEM